MHGEVKAIAATCSKTILRCFRSNPHKLGFFTAFTKLLLDMRRGKAQFYHGFPNFPFSAFFLMVFSAEFLGPRAITRQWVDCVRVSNRRVEGEH